MRLRLLYLYILWDIRNGDVEIPEMRAQARSFNWIDNDIGSISIVGICDWIDIKYTPFLKAVFSMLTGTDGRGKCGFMPWVRFVISICLFTKQELLRTAFNMFDGDQSGALDGVSRAAVAGLDA